MCGQKDKTGENAPQSELQQACPQDSPLGEETGGTGPSDERHEGSPNIPHPGRLPGDEEDDKIKPYGKILIVILFFFGIVAVVSGALQRGELSNLLKRVSRSSTLETRLVDSAKGKVLMLETSGDVSRVVVEVSGQANWLLVSRDDTTAANPALSPDSEQVAYVTERGGGQLVVVSLITDTRRTIDADQIQDAGDNVGFDKMKLCPWTPIAWAPTGDRVAFFGCVENVPLSVAIVSDLSDPAINLAIVARSKFESSDARQLRWLDSIQLVISTPATGVQQATVSTFDVP